MNSVSIFALLTLVLFKFQNCAPAQVGLQAEQDSEVRLIDQWGEGNLEFLSPAYVVQAPIEDVVVQGLCVGTPKGEKLHWQLIDQNQQIVEEGVSECMGGGFELLISQLDFADCASRLELKASRQTDADDNAVTVLRPFCNG